MGAMTPSFPVRTPLESEWDQTRIAGYRAYSVRIYGIGGA